jgi:energy coupling factor transporter S component ThiW
MMLYMTFPEFENVNHERTRLQKLTLAALFAALAVLLSPVSFPAGLARCFPFQHTINVVAGVLLGPFWACGAALVASFARNIFGVGTIFAFPGSFFGALAVGFAASILPQKYRFLAALTEPLATGTLGAWVASFIASVPEGRSTVFVTLSATFLLSSVPGAILGCYLLRFIPNCQSGADSKGKRNKGENIP